MTELVNPSEIEAVVGVSRHATEHWGRAVSAEETVYILHSQACKDSGIDLRQCPYSIALDRGIDHFLPWTGWRRVPDRAVRLDLVSGYLMPDFVTVQQAIEQQREEA